MQPYQRNKLKTAWEITRKIKNWPDAFSLRIRRSQKNRRLLSFQNGLDIICRGNSRDWDVIHELFFAGGYQTAFEYLKGCAGDPVVLDLGGNIGLFSLLAVHTNERARLYAYEPGPPNYRMFEINSLLNPDVASRIELRKEAVAGTTRKTNWNFDADNPGGSGLFATDGQSFPVQVRSFSEVVSSVPGPIALAKIDVEGAEFEMLAQTPATTWEKIGAISLELHDDPEKKTSQTEFLERFRGFGFQVREEAVCSYFLQRR